MGRALIGGLINAGHPPDRIRVADPVEPCREALVADFGIVAFNDANAAAHETDVVVLAVKPQQMREAVENLGLAAPQALYISVAAGITLSRLEDWLGGACAIVRCMPNTPALIGRGAAALYANAAASADQRDIASGLLSAVGSVEWLANESQMDAVTAVSGSGPAYFFLLIELLENAGCELGLAPELSRRLALQTAAGACELAANSDEDAKTLRRRVTSPGGTTERAINAFESAGLGGIVADAVKAACERSVELAAITEKAPDGK